MTTTVPMTTAVIPWTTTMSECSFVFSGIVFVLLEGSVELSFGLLKMRKKSMVGCKFK
jgi:hypothetical protein